jgi:uncharacterized membrane protein YdbT with pleckstrin-like domain
VSELLIRPTAKFLKAGLILMVLVIAVLEYFYFSQWKNDNSPSWLPFVFLVLLLWPLSRWIRWRSIRATVAGDRLRYEEGAASKVTRNIQLSKVQDVRVDQGVFDRMLGIGNISIETSGETSRLTIPNVDRPQSIADELMNRSQTGPVNP